MANNNNANNNKINNNTQVVEKWYFTKEQLDNTPSRLNGYDRMRELSYRQQTANFIQDMGQRLKVSQLCINTAIVYMHRFYVFHSFTNFPWYQMAAAAIFLAAKVEEQPRKLEYVIRCANVCRNSRDFNIDVVSERYTLLVQDLVFNENVLLQTLGFDVAIDHPHTHVVRLCHLVRASKDLAQSSYFLASNSLHLTTMCLQYKPTVVACFCIHLACKWSRWEIPLSTENKEWFLYVDATVTGELLNKLTEEFFNIFETCPSRLKEKIMAIGDNALHNTFINASFDADPKKKDDQKDSHSHHGTENDSHKHRSLRIQELPSTSSTSSHQQREREYREKKEREKLAHGLKALPSSSSFTNSSCGSSNSKQISHGHHRPSSSSSSVDQKIKLHTKQHLPVGGSNICNNNSNGNSNSSSTGYSMNRIEPRDILREAAAKDSPFGIATNKDFREQHKDQFSVRSGNSDNNNKDIPQKRDYLLKSNVTDSNSLSNYQNYNKLNNSDNGKQQQRMDIHHIKSADQTKLLAKSTASQSQKNENEIKRHLSATTSHDKNNSVYINKSTNSTTSQKMKSPFTLADTSKSVLKPGFSNVCQQQQQQIGLLNNKQHHRNNNNNSSNLDMSSILDNDLKTVIKQEYNNANDEIVTQSIVKRPSLFSPENDIKTKLESYDLKDEISIPQTGKRPSLFSPEKSPPPKKFKSSTCLIAPLKMSPNHSNSSKSLSSELSTELESPQNQKDNKQLHNFSEPELRPVIKKIDTIDGFENLMTNSTIGINKLHQVPDIITPFTDNKDQLNYSKEMKPPDIIPPMSSDNDNSKLSTPIITTSVINGVETNPGLISNLLKDTTPVTHLPVTDTTSISNPNLSFTTPVNLQQQNVTDYISSSLSSIKDQNDNKERARHHKKKNKEKHKHKDKIRDERRKKHKDKERNKYKDKHEIISTSLNETNNAPIKLKIQKDKIHTITSEQTNIPLKIKIPKDVIKTDNTPNDNNNSSRLSGSVPTAVPPSIGGLKIKIPKDKISRCNNGEMIDNSCIIGLNNSSGGSSRKRGRNSPNGPTKNSRSSHREGRHSYNKVSNYSDSGNVRPSIRYNNSSNSNQSNNNNINNLPNCISTTHMYTPQNPVYYYPTQGVQMANINVPPPHTYMFADGQIYTQYYNTGYMYTPDMYHQHPPLPPLGNNTNPPLPMDAPPDIPPPPPPE